MKVSFWSSTEYSGFLAGLMRELNASGAKAEQRFQISERSYRSAKSTLARLFLRFRQYVAYPVQLVVALLARRVKMFKCSKVGKVPEPSDLSTRRINEETVNTLAPAHSSRESALSDFPTLIPSHSSDSVAVVSTNTFYAPLLATYLHPNVVHLVYDLFPEAMIHSGKWTEGTLKVRVVRWITKQTLKRAKTNVFLGQRLKDYVESIHGPVENAAIIAVGADQALFGQSPKERLGCEGMNVGKCESQDSSNVPTFPFSDSEPKAQPSILYCGNFGNMHDSQTLFEYWRQLSRSDVLQPSSSRTDADSAIQPLNHSTTQPLITFPPSHFPTFHFCCSGPKRAELEAVLSELPADLKKQIQLGGGLDQAKWIATMESADVALVTMVPGSETVVMPSKTYSAMMAGQAILAIVPEDSDLVDLIKAADCGWFVEPGDVAGLATVIDAIRADPEGLLEKREHAYQYAHAHLGQDALAKDWARTLRS
jgi:glycosyltransferase involved in cell wall biosynthesis